MSETPALDALWRIQLTQAVLLAAWFPARYVASPSDIPTTIEVEVSA